jgi:hypothetical protein
LGALLWAGALAVLEGHSGIEFLGRQVGHGLHLGHRDLRAQILERLFDGSGCLSHSGLTFCADALLLSNKLFISDAYLACGRALQGLSGMSRAGQKRISP